MTPVWPWTTVALLGVYHGINPAMGWLFAVGRGLQEERRGAVWESLLPIALGHAASVGLFVLLIMSAERAIPPDLVRGAGAVGLIAFGLYKLFRPWWHPPWRRMRVSLHDLFAWSFLMSTAHGAGLMLFPALAALPGAAHATHVPWVAGRTVPGDAAALLVHTAAMLGVMTVVAIIVYEKVGLMILRSAWINFDLLWALMLIAAGLLTFWLSPV